MRITVDLVLIIAIFATCFSLAGFIINLITKKNGTEFYRQIFILEHQSPLLKLNEIYLS